MNPVLLTFAGFLLLCQQPTETEAAGTKSSPVPVEYRTEAKNNPEPVLESDAKGIVPERRREELVRSAAFRKAVRRAWRATWNGTARYETGFSIDENGYPGELQSSEFASHDALDHLKLISRSNAFGTFHVHNNYGDPRPSELDINIAKTAHKMVYVGSRDGLYSVDPAGNVRRVFNKVNWFDKSGPSVFGNDKHFDTISVRVFNYAHAPTAILAKAEEEAGKILRTAGVRPTWIDCLQQQQSTPDREICDGGWSAEFPSLRLLSGKTTNKFQDLEFGFADVPVFATVSYDHIVHRAQRDATPFELPIVLGCVMAHELGHLLLGDSKHSPAGIMQASWGGDQIRQALTGRLRFTREESMLIRERVRMLASLPERSRSSELSATRE